MLFALQEGGASSWPVTIRSVRDVSLYDRFTTENGGHSITVRARNECCECSNKAATDCDYGKCGRCCTGCSRHDYCAEESDDECCECSNTAAIDCDYGKCGSCCYHCSRHECHECYNKAAMDCD